MSRRPFLKYGGRRFVCVASGYSFLRVCGAAIFSSASSESWPLVSVAVRLGKRGAISESPVPRFGGGGKRISVAAGGALDTGAAPGFVDRSGTIPAAARGGGGFGGMFLDSSEGRGGGALTAGLGGSPGPGSSTGESRETDPPNPRDRASLGGRALGAAVCKVGAACGGGVLLTCSETWRWTGGGLAKPSERGSREVGRSEMVFAREGAEVDTVSRLGGLGS